MHILADKPIALLSLTALKLPIVIVSIPCFQFAIWKLRRERPDLLPELPEAHWMDEMFMQELYRAVSPMIRFHIRYDWQRRVIELSSIEAKRNLDDLRVWGRGDAIEVVRPLVASFAAWIDGPMSLDPNAA